MRRTKLVCTIGPACDSEQMLEALIDAGMNVARINFSHGSEDYQRMLIRRIRSIRERMGTSTAILQDLQGPKIRIGSIASGNVMLEPHQVFVLTAEPVPGDRQSASVSLATLPEVVSKGHPILLSDGKIELVVEDVRPPEVYCRVIVGGLLSSHKGINLPVSHVPVDSLTEKDDHDLKIGQEEGVDMIALSFVRNEQDVLSARKAAGSYGREVPIIAKIEKHEAVDNIDGIVAVADGVMVARGDLGVEIDLERVPLVQKMIIRKTNAVGKPVITATQMLLRMVDNPRPTRAEATDVANAILDGTDALMLSEETAAGKYPLEAARMMGRIANSVEESLDPAKFGWLPSDYPSVNDAISHSSFHIAKGVDAAAIVTPTWSGSTARLVSRFRPTQPIIATTANPITQYFLSLCWGVTPLMIPDAATIDDVIAYSIDAARDNGHVVEGQHVVVTAGTPVNVVGTTNLIKVHRV